ncbi:MAG: hypothetical protein LWW85_07935, partial [Marinilabiliales bacterium]|nr:hypothetical protein [Marinilabiliales bacterium]
VIPTAASQIPLIRNSLIVVLPNLPAMKKILKSVNFLVILLSALMSLGWIYPEHRTIGMKAVMKLSPEDRAMLDEMWAAAIKGHEDRLTGFVIDPGQGIRPTRLDFAAWMGIAGDHSCSPNEMLHSVLESDWILRVADVVAQLRINLEKARNNSEIINYIRNSDLRLQRVDEHYATRAGSNSVHFLLARKSFDQDVELYFQDCFRQGTDLNAMGAYAYFHQLAIQKAAIFSKGEVASSQKSAVMLAALADEAFALHFLEDAFASGHIAGTWGNASQKKGTHDYYNEKGLEVVTWEGKKMVLQGDAYMSERDAEAASNVIKASLEHLISVAAGRVKLQGDLSNVSFQPDTFNVCRNNFMPAFQPDHTLVKSILIHTPVSKLASGIGELPRFRSEIGPFVGVSAAMTGSTIFNGFGSDQKDPGAVAGLEANLMLGLGLDGVLNEAGDGLIFLQMGWRQDSPSSNQFTNISSGLRTNSLTAQIPGRSAYNLRLRLPFWLIPGDMLIAGPILGIFAPAKLQQMAVTAGNGGLIPWQSGIATGIGRFQFILGREAGISFYGFGSMNDALILKDKSNQIYLLTIHSAKLDFPILEYRPFRSYTESQASIFKVQFSFGVDVPYDYRVISPENVSGVKLHPIWDFTTKLVFNWRHYL